MVRNLPLVVVTRRLAISRNAAISRNHNPRYLELPWYAFWNIALQRLAKKLHPEHCYVAPQFPVWRLWIEDEDEDDPQVRPANTDDEDDSMEEGVDDGSDTSAASLSVGVTWQDSKSMYTESDKQFSKFQHSANYTVQSCV